MNSNSSSPRLPEAFAFAFGFALALRGVDLASPSKAFGTRPWGGWHGRWQLLSSPLRRLSTTLKNLSPPYCRIQRRAARDIAEPAKRGMVRLSSMTFPRKVRGTASAKVAAAAPAVQTRRDKTPGPEK